MPLKSPFDFICLYRPDSAAASRASARNAYADGILFPPQRRRRTAILVTMSLYAIRRDAIRLAASSPDTAFPPSAKYLTEAAHY